MPDFRFSLPPIATLTKDQQLAYHPRTSILVSGGPGTGKTVVTIFRFLRSINEENRNILFTYNWALIYSIKGTLRAQADELFGSLDEERIKDIISNQIATFYLWHTGNIISYSPDSPNEEVIQNFRAWAAKNDLMDEMFFDEGQDLPKTVYANANLLANSISVGADRAQNYRNHYAIDAAEDEILAAIREHDENVHWQVLESNFRNTKEIFELAQKFVPEDLRVRRMQTDGLRRGNNPEIKTGLTEQEQFAMILQILDANKASNIGILLHFANEVITLKNFMLENGYSCAADAPAETSFSYYCNEITPRDRRALESKVSSPFITTFDSCKGLEFDIVIMPFFELSRKAMIRRTRTGRPYATPNHYYVGVTRARNEIYILSEAIPPSLANVIGSK